MIILMLKELSEEYNSRKQHILSLKDIASDDILQILSSEKLKIQANYITKLKSDMIIVILE